MAKNSRRRKERAHVQNRLRGVFFECASISTKEFRVSNISELGLGVEMFMLKLPLEAGTVTECKLTVGYTTLNLRIKLAHFTPETAGFEFVDLPDVMRDAIRIYFEPEIVGASLKLDSRTPLLLKYKDENSNGLDISISDGENLKGFTLHVLGNQVRWTQAEDLQLIQNEAKQPVPDYTRKQLVSLIQSAADVVPSYRKVIENILRHLPIDAV